MVELEVHPLGRPRHFAVRGELDLASVERFRSALAGEDPAGGDLSLDVSELRFLDSSGIRALLELAIGLEPSGRVLLLRASPAVRRTLEIAGLAGRADHIALLESACCADL